ncbi:MAG: hypothetical protein BWK76_17865 [Desulfobulbaceae bacterium A2]|nr:MAG: hypothetical protein BWK76_17865 [Desulfobulbaceae bacterium A2]
MTARPGPLAAGIDVGSTQTKGVLLDNDGVLIASIILDTGADIAGIARQAYEALLAAASCPAPAVGAVAGTGYGRFNISFGDMQVTEISCHARAAVHLFPDTGTVLDMGGQDTKAIRVGQDGGVIDFCMNDKCAAGTGRFLAAAAAVLELPLDQLADIALASHSPVTIGTTCTVFAETEIMAWIARGRPVGDILLGAHRAMAGRAAALLRRVGPAGALTFSGGVARNRCMVQLIEQLTGSAAHVGPQAHLAGALGAALFARDRLTPGRGSRATAP